MVERRRFGGASAGRVAVSHTDQQQVIRPEVLGRAFQRRGAAILEKPVGAVKSLQHRALAACSATWPRQGESTMTQDLSETPGAALDACKPASHCGHPGRYSAEARTWPLVSAAASLGALQAVEMLHRSPLADRNAFLSQMAISRQAYLSAAGRLKGWIAPQFPWFVSQPSSYRKEQRRMSVLLLKSLCCQFGTLFLRGRRWLCSRQPAGSRSTRPTGMKKWFEPGAGPADQAACS